jgi:signal transduction histidine kinase
MWCAFAACLAVVIAAMGWISATTIGLHRAEEAAVGRAALEENVRLALWRVDSSLAPLIARESARPAFVYRAFYPARAAFVATRDAGTKSMKAFAPREVLVPSPLLTESVPQVLLHFMIDAGGRLTSPQVPAEAPDGVDVDGLVPPRLQQERATRLADLGRTIAARDLLAAFAPDAAAGGDVASGVEVAAAPEQGEPLALGPADPFVKSSVEWRARAMNVQQSQAAQQMQQPMWIPRERSERIPGLVAESAPNAGPASPGLVDAVATGPLRPAWMAGALVLARGVVAGGRATVQGCWLDWAGIRRDALASVRDLLPGADLEPVTGDLAAAAGRDPGRLLASLPARLVPGPVPAPARLDRSPVMLTLGVAWACVLLASLAIGFVLAGVVSLSERRAAFASAVTHELRTPLTTFRLYTDLLAGGMIDEPEKRRTYLETLRAEAERLSHLVENVLAYARLERGRIAQRLGPVALSALVDRVKPRLADRAAQARFTLEVESAPPAVLATRVSTDPSAVDQILFNLVDNACKYASQATDRRLHLELARREGAVAVAVRDHGSGIPAREARGLFLPFSKSAKQAAGTAPGVGLGLALSRGLAREMGGDLTLAAPAAAGGPGARFVLTLPVAPVAR